MRPRPVLIGLTLVAALLAVSSLLLVLTRSRTPAETYAYRAADGGELPRLWQAPEFEFPDQAGRMVTRDMLRGRPWVANFFFTQCTTVCPVMTSKLVLVQRELAGMEMRFVSFSVDPAHDTPAALAAYAAGWNGAETRWTLLATAPATLAKAVAGFRVTAQPDTDATNPITHSSVFLLIDGEGWIRGVYDSNDDSAVRRLVADTRTLAAAPGAPGAIAAGTTPVAPLQTPYAALGCAGCHDNPRVAPSLVNLAGRTVHLKDGTTVLADADYLKRSILEPGAQVVAGYLPLMPGYQASLDAESLARLVEEIVAMRADAAPADEAIDAGPAAIAIDPVCDMEVRAAPETIQLTFGNRVIYFCSESCRDHFVESPAKYMAHLQASAPDSVARP